MMSLLMGLSWPGDSLMSPDQFRDARYRLGLSQADFADLFGIASDRTVRRWEEGEKDIPGPVVILVELALKYADVRRHLGLPKWPGETE